MSDGQLVTVSAEVFDRPKGRQHRPRWAVTATFVALPGSEPRCVDYRVRVVPLAEASGTGTDIQRLHETIGAMEGAAITPAEAEEFVTVPAEGIPRYVFEQASQARLLVRARQAIASNPHRFEAAAAEALRRVPVSRAGAVRRGRPPARSLGEKLRILRDVEDAYAAGRGRADVARMHNMSESSLRDLLTWARHTAEPRLFTDGGPGVRQGQMTAEARRMLTEEE